MERGHEIKVLDHGYVKFIDSMGSDEAIVEAARMSTGRGFVSWEPYKRCKRCEEVEIGEASLFTDANAWKKCFQEGDPKGVLHDWQDFPRGDLGMLEFMYKGKHSTPFEFGELHIEVQAPIMVFREWHRHRTQAYSEFSARYSQMPNLHYLPAPDRIQKQSASNRQGSGESLEEHQARSVIDDYRLGQQQAYTVYETHVKAGVAKEIARLNTPVSRYSKMRAKTDLRNWLGFLMLRMAPAAQFEIRQFANAVAEIVKAIWPETYALFEEHDLHGVHLSRTEASRITQLLSLDGAPPTTRTEEMTKLLKKFGGSL